MNKSDIKSLPQYFDRYISYVPEMDLLNGLDLYGKAYLTDEAENFEKLGDLVYATDKWTIKDILQHIIDTERIFTYRALRIARADKTPLPGFDENLFAANAHTNDRKLDDLLDEFVCVRSSTIHLFSSFRDEDMLRELHVNTSDISVVALGYTIVGHVIHHMGVIKERYYPLLHEIK